MSVLHHPPQAALKGVAVVVKETGSERPSGEAFAAGGGSDINNAAILHGNADTTSSTARVDYEVGQ
jgi:hypothetical protein